ncbi:MAG TPA: helix-turn-helix transcriptional regulator [Puia sp.]|uniref:helix-turn-helix domain-containing protein n=1 Tax=Puia sp. TaxID=2045100 RepID=UPI002C59F4C5|nr:helix-turn-helix transcriptional regulator [Puia sp.]HVU96536.1 helix-turn-helix transcriptional regulator [Puia sp.]
MAAILRTIILLGAIQGFIVGGLLVSSARRDRGGARQKRLLAILIGLLAMACLNLYLFDMPEWMNTPLGNLLNALIPLVVVMPIGPLLYLYVRSLLEPEFRLHRRHFYSTAIDLFPHAAAAVYIILLILGVLNPHKNYGFGNFLDDYQRYADIPRWLSLTIYLWFASRYLARARMRGWPKALIGVFTAFAILWFTFLVPYEIPRTSSWLLDRFDWYPLYLPIVVLIYWLGVKGYFISYRPTPAKTALAPEIVEPAVQALKKAMEQDRLWLDPALNLGSLSRHCGLPPKTLSAVLNQHLEKTFNAWVNEYRITAFKDRLLQPESRELTIAGIAYDCGFNSLPTFQRAFKSFTGVTPKEYLQKSLIKSGSE